MAQLPKIFPRMAKNNNNIPISILCVAQIKEQVLNPCYNSKDNKIPVMAHLYIAQIMGDITKVPQQWLEVSKSHTMECKHMALVMAWIPK